VVGALLAKGADVEAKQEVSIYKHVRTRISVRRRQRVQVAAAAYAHPRAEGGWEEEVGRGRA
jgi:hypothetical protein